ncbi:MAG TPA: F0F1 ATP synthase subunit A [Sporichthya sp.]|nr:F0F1 ATP synthase subunit A [Sporichthya sp.]
MSVDTDTAVLPQQQESPPKQENAPKPGMTKGKKITYGVLAVYVLGLAVIIGAYGLSGKKDEQFSIVEPFHVTTWIALPGPLDFNKGVLYLLMTTVITVGLLLWISSRMTERKPNRTQTAVESMYDLIRRMTRENMDEDMAKKYFPLVFSLFVFILVTNLLGYVPLPVNTGHKFDNGFPSFQIYAANTNVAMPFILALGVFLSYNYEGFKHQGFRGYIKSLVPSGVGTGMLFMLYPLEILSHILRLLSLAVRLWANLLAGHMLISFMSGDLAVLLGMPALGWITLPLGVALFLFECALIAGLQAFIFAILTCIYIGGATRSH